MEVKDFSNEITEDQKNRNKIRCQYCNCLILNSASAHYTDIVFSLPLVHQKRSKSIDDLDTEEFNQYWMIEDMYTFENIGFSNTVGDYKYLICADCEMGPFGYHDLKDKKCYLALKRVKYEN
ncbi:hypothetical protein PVAND_005711 [Polypedilum vanderplanki]|uniref:Guanine nucleotide exchange factor MSS4 n=1 Tax=Polypedilum vanderplanki TaxID=319348 RepID=A0A9J6C0W6_POLVA|nr:hypothetical protein PVAND_005711 [Polypedilum vanderplanki]